ncbi:MAG: hypothetical protein Q4C95_04850 [Planctomycetia bacterium]|nr:hypothetical protein [Planctomycetia bacterium]
MKEAVHEFKIILFDVCQLSRLAVEFIVFLSFLIDVFLISGLGVPFLIPVAVLIAFKELPASMQTEKEFQIFINSLNIITFLISVFLFQILAAFCGLDDQIMLLAANSVIGFSIFVILLCFFLAVTLRKIVFLFAGEPDWELESPFFSLRFDRMLTGM